MLPERVGAVIIQDNRILLVTGYEELFYWTPGGKIEKNESDLECLNREIMEELGCKVFNTSYFKTFFGYTHEDKELELICYSGKLNGEIRLNPIDSIDDYLWIGKNYNKNLKLASLLKHQIIPILVNKKLM